MGSQHLPEEGEGLCEGGSGSQVCGGKLHLPRQMGSKDKVLLYSYIIITKASCVRSAAFTEQAVLVRLVKN